MALGTSPRPCWTLSGAMTACIYLARTTARGLAARAPKVVVDTPWLARMFAGLHLGGLGILLMTAWHGTEAAGATIAGLPALHLAFLMATGAAAAALTLMERNDARASADSGIRLPMSENGPDGLRDLIAVGQPAQRDGGRLVFVHRQIIPRRGSDLGQLLLRPVFVQRSKPGDRLQQPIRLHLLRGRAHQ